MILVCTAGAAAKHLSGTPGEQIWQCLQVGGWCGPASWLVMVSARRRWDLRKWSELHFMLHHLIKMSHDTNS